MSLLLDTHIWIWSRLEPHRLKPGVAQALLDPVHERYLSPVSVWEMILLLEKQRVKIQQEFRTWLKESIAELVLQEAPLTWHVAQHLQSVILGHNDPADRFLVATARAYGLTLVTADERLMSVPGLQVLANR